MLDAHWAKSLIVYGEKVGIDSNFMIGMGIKNVWTK